MVKWFTDKKDICEVKKLIMATNNSSGSCKNNNAKSSGNIIKSMVTHYESMESKNRLTSMTVIKQSYQNLKLVDSLKKMTVKSSNVSQLGILGESNCSTSLNRSALETETPNHVTDLKRSPAFHHRKKHLLNNKVAWIC